tara:strand:- start:1049 stop:2182 length:1134 start_codon:yes stop_codon:yes gene_type:complete
LAGIYIHIPFCKQACHYCNFHFSTNLKSKKIIIDSIIKEIKLKSKFENEEIETIYFGGGTPTLLTSLETEAILDCIYKYYKVKSESEITIEANPDDIRIDKLKFLKKLSFNRLSIGVQSFIDSELKLMNRAHNSRKAIRSVEVSKSIFNNISVDLLYGLPNSNIETLDHNINILLDFDIKHISSYALTLEPKTALEKFIKKDLVELPNDDIVFEQFKHVNKELISNDYVNYELSSFAKKNFFSKNNTGYWLRKKYIGIGPSAHSYNGVYRSWNISNNKKYIDQIQSGKLFYKKEILTKIDQYNEYIMTGLRTMWGISINFIENKFGKNFKNHFLKSIKKYIEQKLIHISNGMYITTDSARFLADGIAADLFIIDLTE